MTIPRKPKSGHLEVRMLPRTRTVCGKLPSKENEVGTYPAFLRQPVTLETNSGQQAPPHGSVRLQGKRRLGLPEQVPCDASRSKGSQETGQQAEGAHCLPEAPIHKCRKVHPADLNQTPAKETRGRARVKGLKEDDSAARLDTRENAGVGLSR